MNLPTVMLVSALLSLSMSSVRGNVAWDESTFGDLSGSGLSPTVVNFFVGSNIITGSTGRVEGIVDRDYFTFNLPSGLQLDSLTVLPGTAPAGISGLGFIALQSGLQITVNPTGGSASGLLGWVHYGENDLGTDILGLMGIGFGAVGFDVPLPAGDYSFWIQDTGTGNSVYNFDFGVSAVPEISSAHLLIFGLAGLGAMRTAKRRRLSLGA
jgi:hypothetical protein